MAYVDGFLIPVPHDKKDAYIKMAKDAAGFFKKHGVLHIVECWGDDVPEGKTTDFFRAVKAEEGENVVFSWVIWPSKEVRDAGQKAMMEDPDMKVPDEMPFDGKRMIFGGFMPVYDSEQD